ncbi:S-layer homology domain-containing protein [Paenibacillus sp. 2RAB27]|uniref:S-layer homology domain-containing protein n=1 Tax=Paenibacillus sp. 2RAB27 TaxID=3232991 RepID=UPI003F997554
MIKWKKSHIAVALLVTLTAASFGIVPSPAAAATVVGMDENFNSLQSGNFSATNWTPTLTPDGSIQVVSNGGDLSNQSVRLEKTTTAAAANLTLDRKNLSVTGKAVVSYRLKSDETSGTKSAPYIYGSTTSNNMISLSISGTNINAYNGATSSSILSGFQANRWYHVQFILDTATKKYDAYIDGVKKAAGFAFRDTTASTDTLKLVRFSLDKAQKGTIQFDDLFVDQLPDSIVMEPDYHLTVNAAHSSQVTANYSDYTLNVSDKAFYRSSNPAVAAVDDQGNVTGISLGTAIITSSIGDVTASTTVTVSTAPVLNEVQLDQTNYVLEEGEQQISVLTAVYSDGARIANGLPGVSFVSSDPMVASVDASSGKMSALHYGTSVLTATYGNKSATATVTVLPILQELVSLSPGVGGMDLIVGGTARSITQAVYSDGYITDIGNSARYTSDHPTVVVVDASGNVLAISTGQSVVTVTYGTKSVGFPVRVSSIQLDSRAYTLKNGATHATTVSLVRPDGSPVDVTGQSSFQAADPSIVKVDADGKVTALRSGTTTVTANYAGAEVSAIVTVQGDVAASEFTLQTAASKDTFTVKIMAGSDAIHGALGPIYSAQAEFGYDPAELQLLSMESEMFAGTGNSLSMTDSVYEIAGQPSGFQSIITPESGRILYAATRIGDVDDVNSVSAAAASEVVTLVFHLTHPGLVAHLQVGNMSVGTLVNDSIIQVSPSLISAEVKRDTTKPVWPEHSQVTAGQVSTNSAQLSWSSATDEIEVSGYRIYNGSRLVASVPASASTYQVTNLQSATSYTFAIEAGNAAGNWTNDGPVVTVRTGGTETPPPTPSPDQPVKQPEIPEKPKQPDPSTPILPGAGASGSSKFKDVTPSFDWAVKAIDSLTEKGIIQGTSAASFEPGNQVSRADVITLLVRALHLSADFQGNFNDVSQGNYYYQSLGIAKELGIMSGTGNNEAMPTQAITREDLMVLCVRSLNASGKLNIQYNESVLNDYVDSASISAYARSSVAALIQLGIVEGDGKGLNPRGTASRAEMAVILFKLLEKMSITTK